MFKYLVAVVIPALALSCCPPKQWEGREYIAMGSTSKDGSTHYTEIAQNVTIDTAMRRIFISQQMTYDGHVVHQTILQDFASEEQYVTDMNGRCTRTALDSIEPGCIPQNATTITHSFIGFGRSKIMTTMYKFMLGGSTIYVTVTDDGCIPVAYEATGPTADGGGYQMTIEFFGITLGIVNTSVFQTPHHCPMKIPLFGIGR